MLGESDMTKPTYTVWSMPIEGTECPPLIYIMPLAPEQRQEMKRELQAKISVADRQKQLRKNCGKRRALKGKRLLPPKVLENIVEQEQTSSELTRAACSITRDWNAQLISAGNRQCYQPKEKTIPRTWSAKEFCVRGLLLAKKGTNFLANLLLHLTKQPTPQLQRLYFQGLLRKRTQVTPNAEFSGERSESAGT